MMIVNPFTRQVLNANPEGHNQYVNPDGLSSRGSRTLPTKILPRLRDFEETSYSEGFGNYGGWILPSGDLVDAPGDHGESILETPTDFGIHQKTKNLRDLGYKKKRFDQLVSLAEAAKKRAISTGSIRVGLSGSDAYVEAGDVPISKILDYIEAGKIPKGASYFIDTPDYQGHASLEDLYSSKSLKHLARKKQFGA
jgi:hypothetical protein